PRGGDRSGLGFSSGALLAGRNFRAPSHVSMGVASGRRRSLRNKSHPMTPAVTRAGSTGAPASTSRPIRISTAIATRNANTGLSRTATVIMDNGAQVGRFLMVLPPTHIDLG